MIKFFKTFSIILILSFSVSLYGQTKFQDIKSKMSWGGNMGMSFGNSTYILLAPVLYYNVNEEFVLGGGLEFTYYKTTFSYTEEGSIWSPRLFARYFILDDFFAHVEYQQYYSPIYDFSNNKVWSWSQPYYFAGGGYRQWMGQNSYMFIMLLFDLRSEQINFGVNPKIQMGFSVGF